MVNNTINNHEDEDEEPHSQVSSLHSGMTATHKVPAYAPLSQDIWVQLRKWFHQ